MVEMSYYWRLLYVGSSNPEEHNLMDKLPLQVCQWSAILSVFMLSKRKMIYKPALLLLALGVFSIPANLAYENANYLYLAANTAGASIANLLPTNIWLRTGSYACIVLVAFFLVSMVLPLLRKHFGEKQADSKNCSPSEVTPKK